MKNLTKFLTTAATVSEDLASNYVYNNIDKKQQEKIRDHGTLKKRDDVGGKRMTDKEYEDYKQHIKELYDKYIDGKDEALRKLIDDKTKHVYTAKNLWKMWKAWFWKPFDARKHDDTLLIESSHKEEKDDANEDCKFFVKRSYDKRYGAFYCIDTETAKKKTIEERKKELKEIYDDAVNRGINKIKISLDSHGGPEDYLALTFDIDDIKYLLEDLLDDNKNDKKVLFVNSACYSSDINDGYNVDTEKMILEASKKYPNITFIYEDHYNDDNLHAVKPRYYSNTHMTFRYFLIKNGTITEIDKKNKRRNNGWFI